MNEYKISSESSTYTGNKILIVVIDHKDSLKQLLLIQNMINLLGVTWIFIIMYIIDAFLPILQ